MKRLMLAVLLCLSFPAAEASAQGYGYGYQYGYSYGYYGPPRAFTFGPGFYNPNLYGPADYVYPTYRPPRAPYRWFRRYGF